MELTPLATSERHQDAKDRAQTILETASKSRRVILKQPIMPRGTGYSLWEMHIANNLMEQGFVTKTPTGEFVWTEMAENLRLLNKL